MTQATESPISQEEPRNLANPHMLAPWLESIATMKLGEVGERDERQALATKWLSTVGRKAVMKTGAVAPHDPDDLSAEPEWIQKALAEGKPVQVLELGASDRAPLERALDWLTSSDGPPADSDWTRISLPAALVAEAQWIEELSRQSSNAMLDEIVRAGTRAMPGLEDLASSELGAAGAGYSWVELTNAEALSREGGLMRHCVGMYGHAVASGKKRIFSLRDPQQSPQATVELTRGCFQQLKLRGDSQADAFCALGARALIERLLPDLLASRRRPSTGPDFARTGYGDSGILGFCDFSRPLDAPALAIVKQWLATFGGNPTEVKKEMEQAACSGSPSLFNALAGHAGDWHKSHAISLALFSHEAMLPCLDQSLVRHQKESDFLGKPIKNRFKKHRPDYIVQSIGSGSLKIWEVLSKLGATRTDFMTAVSHLASRPGSVGDADLVRFISWIPASPSPDSFGSTSWLGRIAEPLASQRFDLSLAAIHAQVGTAHFPWKDVAKGAALADSSGILGWVLEKAPAKADFSEALTASLNNNAKRCFALLRSDARSTQHLSSALLHSSTLAAATALPALAALEQLALEGALSAPAYVQALRTASAYGAQISDRGQKFQSAQALAWILKRLDAEPDFPKLLLESLRSEGGQSLIVNPETQSKKNRRTSILAPEPRDSDARKAVDAIAALCSKHLGPQTLLELCEVKARGGLDRPALFFWNIARHQPDFEVHRVQQASAFRGLAGAKGCDALFMAAGGTAEDLAKAGVSFGACMKMGNLGMASILADKTPELAKSMKDILIYAVLSAPMETIESLLSQCDPKRNNSQALIEAVRIGRMELVKLLAPLSDPRAQCSEALRSAAASGEREMVEFLLPLSDPRAGDSQAMRDALRAGYWEIALDLWPLSDPNSGAGEPLALAARTGDLQRLKWMVNHGADPQTASSVALHTLIAHAPSTPNAAFDFLWERSDPTRLDAEDLLLAVKANRPEWVAKILPYANPDAKACLALRTAAKMGELELMQILIPASDPIKAEFIIKAEGFDDEGEAMLLGMISQRAGMTRAPR